MSAKNPPATMAIHMFVPRPLKLVQVDKITVRLYPIFVLTMKPPERTHAFQTNKAALAMPGIDRCMMLDTLHSQLNLSAIVDGVLGDWNCQFRCNWCNFANLTIFSFHNNASAQVNGTTTATNSAILLPVINSAITAFQKQHVESRPKSDLKDNKLQVQ
jgi:hypothetical protein